MCVCVSLQIYLRLVQRKTAGQNIFQQLPSTQQHGNSRKEPTLQQFRAAEIFKSLSVVCGNIVLASTLLENQHKSAPKNNVGVVRIQQEMPLVVVAVMGRLSPCSVLHSTAGKTKHPPPFLSRGEQFPPGTKPAPGTAFTTSVKLGGISDKQKSRAKLENTTSLALY